MDRLVLRCILTPLTLPDWDHNPKGISVPGGLYERRWVVNYESMIT